LGACRRISNKTRIETFYCCFFYLRPIRCRRISNKTRIETSAFQSIFSSIFSVAEGFPIKQGLKLF